MSEETHPLDRPAAERKYRRIDHEDDGDDDDASKGFQKAAADTAKVKTNERTN